jgi:hypothetical protein
VQPQFGLMVVFNLLDLHTDKSLDEMKWNFEMQLSEEFASHACAGRPRVKSGEAFLVVSNAL